MNKIKTFYDGFSKKLIRDYLLGNSRIEQSINTALRKINFSDKNVLDVGCGIGWSSFEFAKKAAFVQGIDLSTNGINVAQELFKNGNLRFDQLDVTRDKIESKEKFDIVTMLDVFEHIPKEKRNKFIQSINGVLKNSGIVYLSCPTIYHQQLLRNEKPQGLQPIDEDIDMGILYDLATQLHLGDVIYFSHKTIWKNNDYFHAIIQKSPVSYKLRNNKCKLDNHNLRFRKFKLFNKKQKLFSKEEINRLQKKKFEMQIEWYKKTIKKIIQVGK